MPEKFIWHIGIALHCLPRIILFPPALHKHYKNTQSGQKYNLTTWWFWLLNLLTNVSQVAENGALLTLTYISSTDNFGKLLNKYASVFLQVKKYDSPCFPFQENVTI